MGRQQAKTETPPAAEALPEPVPTVGIVVFYALSEVDVATIKTNRRDTGRSPLNIGNEVEVGDRVPLLITKVWQDEPGGAFNGQCFLDGWDTLWITSTSIGEAPGLCTWPPMTRALVQDWAAHALRAAQNELDKSA